MATVSVPSPSLIWKAVVPANTNNTDACVLGTKTTTSSYIHLNDMKQIHIHLLLCFKYTLYMVVILTVMTLTEAERNWFRWIIKLSKWSYICYTHTTTKTKHPSVDANKSIHHITMLVYTCTITHIFERSYLIYVIIDVVVFDMNCE